MQVHRKKMIKDIEEYTQMNKKFGYIMQKKNQYEK